MDEKIMKKVIGNVLNEIADNLEFGNAGKNIKIGITTLESEHGIDNIIAGAEMAQKKDDNLEVLLIGPPNNSSLKTIEAKDLKEAHQNMEKLLDENIIQGAVTMHYNFPIGVSTVGRVVTPGKGRDMFIATTTGTSSSNRVEAMVKNAIYGIIAAKSTGIIAPKVGILNVDGARQVERILISLKDSGYKMELAESMRSDGGHIMRGNDLLLGTPDVMVTDSLTGNLLIKMFSAYTTGGSYESIGYGYGPGIGENYNRNILILSRASGIPVVANALKFAAEVAKGNISKVAKEEFESSKNAGINELLVEATKKKGREIDNTDKMPDKEVVTASIAGIDIMELEDAVKELLNEGIYAESGMGCTGPIIMVNDQKLIKATEILNNKGYTAKDNDIC
ncbi:glycine/sarcosine/betaine reductase complex component C subunit alpha [Clostridiisalibacter paucivorans]|uniref:glycine/sarcosine/betaine reductase complex component C subunit alpha n=1 Tax=Clostridiisalibacter paucivorans TaxID=408753 RepID=UPI00054FFF6D|nr:glycine/sarcosine/betaine reductase complex component C subunit alpha [Clostridiisalibacter paucivorans]